MYNEGISRAGDVLDLAVLYGVVGKSGAWFDYNDQKIAQGREAAKQFFIENPKILAEIEKKTKEAASKEV
jgi:recombination protein RecA